MRFNIIDLLTGEYPDLESIVCNEDWAQGLVNCDMSGFAIDEEGSLILQDECGNYIYCPHNRFSIKLILEFDRTISYSFIY